MTDPRDRDEAQEQRENVVDAITFVLCCFVIFVCFATCSRAADLMRPATGTTVDHKLRWPDIVPAPDYFYFQSTPSGVHPPTWTNSFGVTHASAEYLVRDRSGNTRIKCCRSPAVVDRKLYFRVSACKGAAILPPCAVDAAGKCAITATCGCCSKQPAVEQDRLEVSTVTSGELATKLKDNE